MASTKDIDLLVRVKMLEKLVDKLTDRCDEAVIKAKQSEDLVKQVLEIVQKTQKELEEKEVWSDAPAPSPVSENDELSMFAGQNLNSAVNNEKKNN